MVNNLQTGTDHIQETTSKGEQQSNCLNFFSFQSKVRPKTIFKDEKNTTMIFKRTVKTGKGHKHLIAIALCRVEPRLYK